MQTNLALSIFIFVFCEVCVSEALLSVLHISLAVRADDSGLGKIYIDIGPWVEIVFRVMQVCFAAGLKDYGTYLAN